MALVLVSPQLPFPTTNNHSGEAQKLRHDCIWRERPFAGTKLKRMAIQPLTWVFLQKIKNNTNFVVSISFLGGHTAHTVSVWKYIEAWLADLYLLAGRYKASVEFVIFFPPGVIVCAHYVLRASVISRIFLRLEFPSRAPVKSPHAVSFPCQQIPVCLCPSSSHLLNQSL